MHTGPTRHLIRYTAWDGHLRSAVLLLPAWYERGSAASLPLVITPHGRGESPVFMADRWGRLPNRDDFAVICPAGEGERLPGYSCAAPGQIPPGPHAGCHRERSAVGAYRPAPGLRRGLQHGRTGSSGPGSEISRTASPPP